MARETEKPIDRLVDQSRVMGASRIIRDSDNVTEAQGGEVIAAFEAFRRRTGVTVVYAARSTGMSAANLKYTLEGRYSGDWRAVMVDLDRWLEDEIKREQSPRPTDFVWTTVAEEIQAVAEATIELRTIGLVYGDTGIGKTLALQAIAAEKPGAIYCSVKTAASSAAGVIELLAKPLQASGRGKTHSTRHVLDEIEQKLRGTSCLLIVDEVHKLCTSAGETGTDKALNVLRDLHDHTGIPILLSGTTDLVAYLERRQVGGREPLGQIRSRIDIRRDLNERTGDGGGTPLFTVEEIRKVFARSKMRLAPEAVRYLAQLANLPGSGGLRACRNVVIMATKVHQSRADVLTAEMLRSVHQMLVNRQAFNQVEARMEDARPKPAKMA